MTSAIHDREFVPVRLLATEGAPSSVARWVLYAILLLVGALFLLAFFGRVDQVAVSRGRLIPTSYVQVIQAARAGIIREILAREGSHVHKGDPLVRLEEQVVGARADASALQLERSRLNLVRVGAQLESRPLELPKDADPGVASETIARFASETRAHDAELAQERAGLSQRHKEREATDARVEELVQTLDRLRQEEAAINQMASKGYVSRLQALAKERERISAEQQLVAERQRLLAADDAIEQQRQRVAGVTANYRQTLEREANELRREVSALIADQEESSEARDASILRAPQDGVVKDLATHTIGSFVQAGDAVMSLVPDDDDLRAEIWIDNQDMERVHEGLGVRLKIDALDFRRHGLLPGTLVHVGPDATEPQANGGRGSTSATAPGERPPAFRGLVAISREDFERMRNGGRLSPGMAVTAEILVGKRTVMEYLLSPIKGVASEAGQEP